MNDLKIPSILFLASNSLSRKKLLQDSKINFYIISQNADESQCSLDQSLESLVRQLAVLKMNNIIMPVGHQGQVSFFLTADSMTLANDGSLYGKPVDRDDAIRMLKMHRKGTTIGTAFCLERKIFDNNIWVTQERIVDYDKGCCVLDVSDSFIDVYLKSISFMTLSGAGFIEGFGEQFVKEVSGCYSAILGLPMYKLRKSLFDLGFDFKK